jgi:hypothetical protein
VDELDYAYADRTMQITAMKTLEALDV